MKNTIKYLLQKLLGLNTYLKIFARYKIKTLKRDKKECDFFIFLEAISQEGDLIDAGANLGVMSYHFCKHFPNRTTYAFEPIPLNFSILSYVKKKYGLTNLEAHPMALSSDSGDLTMILPEKSQVVFHGLAHVKGRDPNLSVGKEFVVQSSTIDSWVQNKKIAAIKLDVENFEFDVLKGAENLLKNQKPIVYTELWENENRAKCFELMKSLGYNISVVEGIRLVPYDGKKHVTQNFVFQP